MLDPSVRLPPRLELPDPDQVELVPKTRPPAPVIVAVPWLRVPLTVKSEERVWVVPFEKVTLFQVMPFVLRVVLAATERVEPAVVTVPAV